MQHIDEILESESERDRAVEQLSEFLRIPSVSADPAFADSIRQAAHFVMGQIQAAGCQAELVETAGHPIVLGRSPAVENAPTVLVYGHYDVQPATVADGWDSEPFEPTVKEGNLYARGATDDKGQLFTHIRSVAAWRQAGRPLPINVIYLIEGEEEVGSENLETFLEQRKQELACDIAVISDTSQYGPGMPAITRGLRGVIAGEVTIEGPSQDLHSGVFGGAVVNPVNELCRLVGLLHDPAGRVAIEGFYDDVLPLADEEREAIASLPFDEPAFLAAIGLGEGSGEAGYSFLERRWARPTCDVNGISGGYQGAGPKTIVPARATAKITCRLVPDQDPDAITAALEAHFRREASPAVTVHFTRQHGAPAIVIDAESPAMSAAKRAITQAFGTEPVLIREGGSIPVVGSLKEILGVDTLLVGWGQNSDNLHGPNEHFSLDDFHCGTRASAYLWQELGKNGGGNPSNQSD